MPTLDELWNSSGGAPAGANSARSMDDIWNDAAGASPSTRTWGGAAKEAVGNLPRSAWNAAKQIGSAVAHPIDTAQGLGRTAIGAAQKAGIVAVEKGDDYRPYAEAVGKMYADKYGGAEKIKNTLAADPAGMLMDASTVLTGGGGLAARAPGIAGRVGEIAGAAGRAVDPVNVAAKIAKPTITGPARDLMDAGVRLTPGQMATGGRGIIKGAEDALTSVPILGDFINSGRRASVETFNTAVANQALEPIGERLSRGTTAGHDAVAEVERKLGAAYDRLLPQLSWTPDAKFSQDFQQIVARDIAVLPAQQQKQFRAILQSRVGTLAPMSGPMYKQVESELRVFADKYRSSADAAHRDLAHAIDNTVKAARDVLERSNPAQAAELGKINYGYAMFARMRDAAQSRRTSEGIFTPSDLLGAVKRGDKSVGKGAFARGDALMQEFAEAGQKVLPSSVPDSGTARRLLTAAVGGGAAAAHPSIVESAVSNPAAWAAAAGVLPYTRPGMRATNAWMNPNTRFHQAARNPIVPAAGRAAFQAGRASDALSQQGALAQPEDALQ